METNPSLFDLPDKTFFKIGEVAEILGVKPYVLRYWESEFKSLAPQKSNQSRHRMYTREDIELLLAIKGLLYDEMYTVAGARRQLSELQRNGALAGEHPVEDAEDPLDGVERAAFEQEIEELRTRLEQSTQERDDALVLAREATDAVAEVEAAREALDLRVASLEEMVNAAGSDQSKENASLKEALAVEQAKVAELQAQRQDLLDAAWPEDEGEPSTDMEKIRASERELRATVAERAASRRRLVHNLRGKVTALIELVEPYHADEAEDVPTQSGSAPSGQQILT